MVASRGVGPDIDRGGRAAQVRELLVALVAVWKAGGAYLPIDPAYPSDRLAFVLTDAAPDTVLTDRDTARRCPAP